MDGKREREIERGKERERQTDIWLVRKKDRHGDRKLNKRRKKTIVRAKLMATTS